MIEIFGRQTSYNVQKVLWLADELALDYVHTEVGGKHGGNDSESFLAINPLGKVPVLRIDNKILCESNTIVRYLAERYSNGQWLSKDPYIRGQAEQWMDWCIDRLEPAFVGVFWGYYRTPPAQHDNKLIQASVIDCESCLQTLDRKLTEQTYLIAHHATVADIATGVFLHRLRSIDLTIQIPANVDLWHQRLTLQSGYQKWVMSDFSELQGRSSY